MGNWFSKLFFGDAKPDPVSKNAEIRNSEGQNSGEMGDLKSKVSHEHKDVAKMRKIVRNEGHSGIEKYINSNIDRWQNEPVKFGIIGRSATGKSSFINLVRNIKKGEEGYAEVGRGNTTRSPTPYVHPDNKQIVYWDLPGVGTLKYRKDNYVDQMALTKYDYFFIFFDTVLHEDDLWIAEQLMEMEKPFCFVRSKVDEDIKKGLEQGIDERNVLINLRTEILESINSNINPKSLCKTFFISCEKKGVGEIDILFQHIKENLPSIKFEAVIYSLHTLSKEVIEEKYQALKSRVIKASVGTAIIAALPIPGLDVLANIKILAKEIKHYIDVFGLTSEHIRKVSYRDQNQLKCRKLFGLRSDKIIRKKVEELFIQKYFVLTTALSISDIILPILGSAVSAASTATIAYTFLNEILENLHQDAMFLYDIILPLPERIISSLRVIFENKGQEGIHKYIGDVLNRWKEETVILGVIGEPYSGKNEFVNFIRRLKIGDSGSAIENETTTPYYHPNNEGIVFIGTRLSDCVDTILSRSLAEMQISCYDDLFVFLKGNIYKEDLGIFRNMNKIERSFSVIRTKPALRKQDQETILGKSHIGTDLELLIEEGEDIDSDRFRDIIFSHIYNEEEDETCENKEKDETCENKEKDETCENEEEDETCENEEEDETCKNDSHPDVCVLSLPNIGIGDTDELIKRMIHNLPPNKSEAVVNALHPLSKVVIEEKFQSLRKRLVFVTAAATSTTAIQIPSFCFPVNMRILVDEIKHYIQVFGFSDNVEDSPVNADAGVNKLLCRELIEPGVVFSDIINRQLNILSKENNIEIDKIADWFVPVAGSVVSTVNNAAIVYKCLTGLLENFRHDALVVHDRVIAECESG